MPRDWRLRIQDIIDCIEKIQRYTSDLSFGDFAEDEIILDAVERNLITIGEAARYVPEEIKGKYPDVPWLHMRNMGNVAAHRYFGMDPEIMWDTVRQNLPPLVPKLRNTLESET